MEYVYVGNVQERCGPVPSACNHKKIKFDVAFSSRCLMRSQTTVPLFDAIRTFSDLEPRYKNRSPFVFTERKENLKFPNSMSKSFYKIKFLGKFRSKKHLNKQWKKVSHFC